VSPPRDAIEAALGASVVDMRPVSGGDANHALKATLADERDVFVKYRRGARRDLYQAEADGLAWLRSAGALDVPRVLAVGPDEPAFLALEWVESGPSSVNDHQRLGEGLARLHAAGAEQFGYRRGNYIGPLSQPNDVAADWPEFYGRSRLQPMAVRAGLAGGIDRHTVVAIEQLALRLPELLPADEPPARLHGDLWSGNVIFAKEGGPVLVDPAVYAGHREIDLAMMRLFGGFDDVTFAAYQSVAPLQPGWEERVPIYQLYPLLVHAVLFGATYGSSIDAIVARYTA